VIPAARKNVGEKPGDDTQKEDGKEHTQDGEHAPGDAPNFRNWSQ
jgi:hypothetical protein